MAKDSPQEIKSANEWLNQASETLQISPELTRTVLGDLLDLTKNVAHGPSRPAAPVTAFLVGLSTGQAQAADTSEEDLAAAVRERIAKINATLEEYQD